LSQEDALESRGSPTGVDPLPSDPVSEKTPCLLPFSALPASSENRRKCPKRTALRCHDTRPAGEVRGGAAGGWVRSFTAGNRGHEGRRPAKYAIPAVNCAPAGRFSLDGGRRAGMMGGRMLWPRGASWLATAH